MKWLVKVLSKTVRVPVALLVLVLVMGGGTLIAEYTGNQSFQATERHQQAQQQRQGEVIERKLCRTFSELAANKPPAGNPKTNPSRKYDQENHAILAGVGPDIGCP